jgi:TonB family protein
MKSVLAMLTLGLALSMCNLTSRMRNTNTINRNDNNSSGSSATPSREIQMPPPPPPSVSQNNSSKTSRTVSGGVLNGKAISLPPPAYPPIARAAHASGTVTVQVLVDEEGKVVTAHAVSGHPLLQAAAVQAARQAKFAPTKLSGQPVKVSGVIVYNFVAQ